MRKILLLIMFVGMISLVSAAHALPTNFTNETTGMVQGMGDWANNVTQGTFWMFMLLGFCVVAFMATINYGTAKAGVYSGFIAIVGSIMLGVIGWMSWFYSSMFIIVGTILIAIGFYSKN